MFPLKTSNTRAKAGTKNQKCVAFSWLREAFSTRVAFDAEANSTSARKIVLREIP
jgi:hypothetical protein